MSPFVGDGEFCTLDTDDDSFPDIPLQSPTCTNPATSNTNFCSQVIITNNDDDDNNINNNNNNNNNNNYINISAQS